MGGNISERLRRLRQRYGVSQKSLGILLGISEPSMVRYETGRSTPSPSNARLLELAEDPDFMRLCLKESGDLIPAAQRRALESALADAPSQHLHRAILGIKARMGFAEEDLGRVGDAMNYLASRCSSPYYTRVAKACFIADFLSYEGSGVSLLGLSYAHAPHGPIIDGNKGLRRSLEESGALDLEDDGLGLLIRPCAGAAAATGFTAHELEILDRAAAFVDSFETVGQLSEATHALPCWKDTRNGEDIPYRRGSEVTELVESRLYAPNEELASRIDAPDYERVDLASLFSEATEDA